MIKKIIIKFAMWCVDGCLSLPVWDDEDRAQHRELIAAWKKLDAIRRHDK